jgi:hypothetical protein
MDTDYVSAFLVVWLVLTVGLCTFVYLRSKANLDHRAIIERLRDASTLYSDNFCSGRSLKSFRTKYGGARNCLKVVVTRDGLFLLAPIQFLVYFTEKFDLEHDIPKNSIREFEKLNRPLQSGFRVSYLGQSGETRTIELWPRRPKIFEQAMNVGYRATT